MRRYIYTVLIFLSVFILSACGGGDSSNSISDPSIPDAEKNAPVVLFDAEKIITDLKGENFTLRLHLMKNENGNYLIQLDNFDLNIDGCNIDASSLQFDPASIILDGNALSRKDTLVSGVFATTCLDAKDKKYVLAADMTMTINGKTEKSKFTASSSDALVGGGEPPSSSGYSFYNATTTTVSQANTPYDVKVQLIKDDYAVSGKNVRMKAFSSAYGAVGVYDVTTGADGFASFDYTSPAVLPANGTSTSLEVSFIDENNSTIKQNLVLNFNTSGGGDVNPYNLINPSTPIEVTGGNQDHSVSAYVVDASTGVGVAGKDVTITTIANGHGSINTATTPTDAAGKAEFIYTSPASITGLTSTTVKMRFIENGITSEQEVIINFTVPPGGGSQYSLINETTPVTVTRPDQVETISVTLVDSATLVGVEDKTVVLSTPTFGNLTTSTTTTNAAGKAEFGYQAPSDLTGLTTTTIRFSFIEDSVTVTKDINITVNPTGTASEYTLTNANDITVNYATQSTEIAVQVIKNGAPVAGESVTAKSISAAFGRIENATVTTGADGYARFNYIAADTLTDGTRSLELVHTDLNGAEATANVNITVLAQTQPLALSLVNETADINITHKDQVEIISVYVVNTTSNVGVAGKTVSISTIASGSGSVSSATAVTDASGKAEFTYQAPSNITGLAATGTTLSFTENDVTITKAVTIAFNEQIAKTEYALTNANDITVNYPTQSGEIAVQVIKNGAPVAGESVTAKSISAAFGRIENATVTTGADGYARFNYIAADTLTDGTRSLELVHTDLNGAEATANVNITVLAQTQPLPFNLVNETTPVIITQANQEEEITVFVVDTNNVGAVGKSVSISVIEGKYGTIFPATTTTDASGKAVFTYTAPSDLNDTPIDTIAVLNFTESSVTLTADVNIRIIPSATVSPYRLINQSDINGTMVMDTSMSTEVQLVKNGIPVIDVRSCTATDDTVTTNCVIPASIDRNFGRIIDAAGSTTRSGYVDFNYTAPELNDRETVRNIMEVFPVYYIDENGKIAAEANITINLTVVRSLNLYEFTNESNITIEHGSQKEDVKVQLTYNGIPIAGKTVNMLAFSEGNGTILNSYSVVTDSVGYATFFYMAPAILDDVNGTTLSLTMQFDEGATHLETNASIVFNETTDNVEGNVSLPIVVIPETQREIILNSNSMTFDIPIAVWKDIAPYAEGSVKVEFPEKVLNGVDVGLFAAYEVEVNDKGIANFSYTGPSNLQALMSNDDNESIFQFYHVENSANKQPMKVLYQLPGNDFISRNYELDIVTSNDDFSMGIPEKERNFNVLLKAKDSTGNDVNLDTETITKITVLTTNGTIAQILNTASDPATLVDSLELNPANNSPFILQSKKLSGLVPIEVIMEFTDVNGKSDSRTAIVNVRVFSGPASAISISYVSTGQDVERAKYIETLAISVTDEYGNRVNTRPNITLGAIVGYAVDGAEVSGNETNKTKRLFYGRSDIENGLADGVIDNLGDSDSNTTEFSDAVLADPFAYVNVEGNNTDKLVVFGEQKNYEAMGKWDITKIDDNTLSLQDDYYGVDRSGLYYAVGHNYYQDQCREDGREWVGTTDSETYKLDEEGTVTVTYKYDYHLTGKDALVWVNLDGIQPDTGAITRVGETVKHTLRGTGFTKAPTDGYLLAKGTAGYGTFVIWHENAPERYRNAHFSYAMKSGSTCRATVVAISNPFDARTCNNSMAVNVENNTSLPPEMVSFGTSDGTSYVTFYLEDVAGTGCTFDIDNITVSSEF